MRTSKALTPLQRFFRLLKPDSKDITNIYVYALFNGVIGLSLPLGIQAIINLLQGGSINSSWIILVTFVVIGVAVTGTLQIFQLRITENIQQKIFARTSIEFAYRVLRIRNNALKKYHAPELMNRLFDALTLQKGLSKILVDFSTSSLQIIFSLLLLAFYHPFFILFGLTLVVIVCFVMYFSSKKGLRLSIQESTHKYRVAHWLEELGRNRNNFQTEDSVEWPLDKADEHVSEYLNAREGHFKVLLKQYSVLVIFKVLLIVGLLGIGGVLVMEEQMNIGQFVAAEVIIILMISSVEKLMTTIDTIYDVMTSLEKIGFVSDLPVANCQAAVHERDTSSGYRVQMKNLKVSFDSHSHPLISKVDLSIPSSSKVQLTGPSRSGKTALLGVMSGRIEASGGNLLFNDVNKLSDEARNLSGIQGIFAFDKLVDGNIRRNITLGKSHFTEKEIMEACKRSLLIEDLRDFKTGLDTVVSREGIIFPASTRFKIFLTRAFLYKPQLLLIEGIPETIDLPSRKQIMENITTAPWTLILESNNASMTPYMDGLLEVTQQNLRFSNIQNQ